MCVKAAHVKEKWKEKNNNMVDYVKRREKEKSNWHERALEDLELTMLKVK